MALRDSRKQGGRLWNASEVKERYPLPSRFVEFTGDSTDEQPGLLDDFVYTGFRLHGAPFLRALRGRFSVAHEDSERGQIFLARDWIGEAPFHYLTAPGETFCANTIDDLRSAAGPNYSYSRVRAFPQGHYQLIYSPSETQSGDLPKLEEPFLYRDFLAAVEQARDEGGAEFSRATGQLLRTRLLSAVRARVDRNAAVQSVLLSGGLDSFSVALSLKLLDIPFEAYTLSVNGQSNDVSMASAFASKLQVTHHIIRVATDEIESCVESAIRASECYHLFNVYCAVGMLLLARRLSQAGVRSAFCGEAVNEALGDYKDWRVKNPNSDQEILLQRVNSERLREEEERALFVWGYPRDRGRYNRQLGTGLAKHAGSRMVKPFRSQGVALECPYYDTALLAQLIAIPADTLENIGGKPGLFEQVFREDIKRLGIPPDLVRRSSKVRLQDASEGGDGGITQILVERGLDQVECIEIFNRAFGAQLDPVLDGKRIAWCK